MIRTAAALLLALLGACAPDPSSDEPLGARADSVAPSSDGEARGEANVVFRRRLRDDEVFSLLREHRALPYAAFGHTRWDHRVAAAPRAASETLVEALREGAIRRARAVLCDAGWSEGPEPSGVEARRALADLLSAERLIPALEAGRPLVYALRVTAPLGELERLRRDPRVERVEVAERPNGFPVLPDVVPAAGVGREPVPEVEVISEAAVRVALRQARERAACGWGPAQEP